MPARSLLSRTVLIVLAPAMAATLATGALAAGANELSTGGSGLGINQAIRDGETRRGAQAPDASQARVLTARPEFASYPVYVGTVGERPVRMRIAPKKDERDSLHGEYSMQGAQGVRLLAGEWDGSNFLMEESTDGVAVTGNWEGQIDSAGAVRGNWIDPFNPAIILPFLIRPLGGVLVIPPFDMTPNSGVTHAPPPPKSSISGWR